LLSSLPMAPPVYPAAPMPPDTYPAIARDHNGMSPAVSGVGGLVGVALFVACFMVAKKLGETCGDSSSEPHE